MRHPYLDLGARLDRRATYPAPFPRLGMGGAIGESLARGRIPASNGVETMNLGAISAAIGQESTGALFCADSIARRSVARIARAIAREAAASDSGFDETGFLVRCGVLELEGAR